MGKYDDDECFRSALKYNITILGKVREIICEGCDTQPHDWYITFIDENNRSAQIPLKPNSNNCPSEWFNSGYHMTLLNLVFQKVLNQIGEDGNSYWLLEPKQIDSVLKVLKRKLPFRTITYNEQWFNLNY